MEVCWFLNFYSQKLNLYDFRLVFWMIFGILIGTGIFYLIFADGKVQPWNDPKTLTINSNNTDDHDVEISHEMKENYDVKNF